MAKSEKRLKSLNNVLNVYTVIGALLWITATVLILTPALPYLWYRVNTGATEDEVTRISEPITENEELPVPEPEIRIPPFDPTLPATNMLIIEKIGVYGEIHEDINPERGLEKGIWRTPDFGTPDSEYTVVLASHRYGYIWWSNETRKLNSFYSLPDLTVGDQLQIIWNQRKYFYEVYRAEDSSQVTDYEADLILYTCKMFNSPVRVFRYAKRI